MFTDILDSLMAQKGINRNVLSKESGIPYTTIDGWYKKGCDDIRLSTLKKLKSYFNVSLDYLMEEKAPDDRELSEEAIKIAKCFDNAGEDGRFLLKHVADYISKADSASSPRSAESQDVVGIYSDLVSQTYSQQDIPEAHQK